MKNVLFCLIFGFSLLYGSTLVVDQNYFGSGGVGLNCEGFSTGTYQTIQAAVNDANNSDTIKICKGDYNEQATVKVDNLTITNGANVSTPTDVNWYYDGNVLNVGDSNHKPKNLTVENISLHSTSSSSNSKAIDINYAKDKITLQNLVIKTDGADAVYDEQNVDSGLEGVFKNLTIKSGGSGIYINKGSLQDFEDINFTLSGTNANNKGIYLGTNVNNGKNHIFKSLSFSLKAQPALSLSSGKNMIFEDINITADSYGDTTQAIGLDTNVNGQADLSFKNMNINLNKGVGVSVAQAKDISVENAVINGSTNYSFHTQQNVTGNLSLKNSKFDINSNYGLLIEKGKDVTINSVDINGSSSNGWGIQTKENVTGNLNFSDVNVTTHVGGIDIAKGKKVTFDNIKVNSDSSSANDVGVNLENNSLGAVSITNSELNATGDALRVAGSSNLTVDSSKLTTRGDHAIYVKTNVKKATLKNSCFHDTSSSGNSYAIYINDWNSDIKINNNCIFAPNGGMYASDVKAHNWDGNYWGKLKDANGDGKISRADTNYISKNIVDNSPQSSCQNSCGSGKIGISPVTPTCNLKNGLELATYDISKYSQHYPKNDSDFSTLESDYAQDQYKFGQGEVDTINTTGSNNNPYHSGTDDKYLSIFKDYIYIPQAGTYSFAVNGDDAVEVIFDDTETLGWYGGHGTDSTSHNKEFTFNKAGYYKLEFRHQEWGGGDNYQLYWEKPGDSSYAIVPKDNLFYCAPPKPIANYQMDDCLWNGTTGEVKDSSENGLNGTAENGATTETNTTAGGGICHVGKFDGNDSVDISHSDILKLDGNLTFMSWIKRTDPNHVGNDAKLENIYTNQRWDNALRLTEKGHWKGGGKILFQLHINGSAVSLYSNDKIDDTKWHQVVGVYDGNEMHIYIDDNESGSKEVTGSVGTSNSGDSYIGTEKSSYYFDGNIDELKIYNRALNDTQIQDIYNNEKDKRNYDGSARSCTMCPVTPTCNLQNGLELATYDISNYSQHYPQNDSDFSTLESDYAQDQYKFGKGEVDTIDTTGSNNNPYHSGTDDKYLSIFKEYIYIPQAGTYSFAVNGDDAVEVIFNDTETLGWYNGHGSDSTSHNKEFTFNKAGYYKLEFRHQEWGGGDNYQLYWEKPNDGSYSIVPKDNLFYCGLSPSINNYQFNAVSSIGGTTCNAVSDWDNNLTTQIVNQSYGLYILSKNEQNISSEANITKVALNYYDDGNTTTCRGKLLKSVVKCDDNSSNTCNVETNASGCFYYGSINTTRAVKCVQVYIEGKDLNNTSNNTNESNSTDDYVVRPKEFKIVAPTVVRAGNDFNIDFEALDFNDNNTTDYNEINGTSFMVNYHETNSSCLQDGKMKFHDDLNFTDGNISTKAYYSEVGHVNIKIYDNNDTNHDEFAKVDKDDTNDSVRLIKPTDINITVLPDHFEVNATLRNGDTNFTYLSQDLNMSAQLDINITAQNKQNGTTKNYNSQCYAQKTDYNISYAPINISPSGNLNNLIYIETNTSINGNVSINNDINLTNMHKNIFGTDHNGTAQLHLKINFDRNASKFVNPFDLNITDINVKDANDTNGTNNLDKNATFYYGRVRADDIITQKTTVSHLAEVEVYDDNSTSSYVSGFKRNSLKWYRNEDDNISSIKEINGTKGTTLKNVDINISHKVATNGTIKFDINNSATGSYYMHINTKDWLWYIPSAYGDDYNDSVGSNCTTHPCFLYTLENNSSGKDQNYSIKSGDFNGSDYKLPSRGDLNRTGIKVYR